MFFPTSVIKLLIASSEKSRCTRISKGLCKIFFCEGEVKTERVSEDLILIRLSFEVGFKENAKCNQLHSLTMI